MYHTLLGLCICSFLLCLVLTPYCRDLFLRFGLVDRPDADRRFHVREVPRIGGLPILISYAVTLALLLFAHPGGARIYMQHRALYQELLPAAALIFLTGLIDDIVGLKPWHKLAGQCLAAGLAVSLGARLAFGHLPVWLSISLSFIWLIGCTNAFNLIDGMDGLATGVSLIASVTAAVVAMASGNVGLALATVPLAGCLLGFLRYNFSPASIFLGDCGSLTIGFMLGCFSLIWSQHASNLLGMAAPMMVLALPLVDVLLAIARRYIRNAPIFKGDRGHIHHMMLGLGFSTRTSALILYAVCFVFALLAVMSTFGNVVYEWGIVALFVLLVFCGIDRLNYVEWNALNRVFKDVDMRRAIQGEIFLIELRRSLLNVQTVDDCWHVIQGVCRQFEFSSARMELLGITYTEEFREFPQPPDVRIQIHLGAMDFLLLARSSDREPPRIMMRALGHLQTSVLDNVSLRMTQRRPVANQAA